MKLAEAVEKRKIKIEKGTLTKKVETARFPSPATDIYDDMVTNPKGYSTETSSNESDSHRYYTHR